MKLRVYDPFVQMEELLDRYSRADKRDLARHQTNDILSGDWSPVVDVEEKNDHFLIKAELPGVRKEDVFVSIENGVLTIKGEKKQEKEEKDKKFHLVECSYGSFVRTFSLPANTKTDQIDANYKEGILYLKVPKSDESKPKQIEVKVK